MIILVVLASENSLAREIFERSHEQILRPEHLPSKIRGQVTLRHAVLNPKQDNLSLAEFIYHDKERYDVDGVTVLLDSRCAERATSSADALLVGALNLSEYAMNMQNVLSGAAARLLRNFGFLLVARMDQTSEEAATLPLRNFEGQELQNLANACRELALNGEFPSAVRASIQSLIARRGPKRRSKFPDIYFRDDAKVDFSFGHEHHGAPPTGGSHTMRCKINGDFRFGKRIDSERHFNVTHGDADNDKISGTYRDCHDVIVTTTAASHINMWSNDFHK